MSILTGYVKQKKYKNTSGDFKLCSQWTSSNTVEMDDGTTLEAKASALNSKFSNYLPLSGGTMTGKITIGSSSVTSEIGIIVHNSNHRGRFVVGSTGNLGIYSNTNSKWLCYQDAEGNGYFAGNAETVTGTLTNPTSATTYYIPFHSSASTGNKTMRNTDGIKVQILQGTADATGFAGLYLGNDIASGTAGNKHGYIALYSNTKYSGKLKPSDSLTADRTYTFPNSSGTVALTSSTVAAANKLGSSTVGSSSRPIYLDSGTATACTQLTCNSKLNFSNSSGSIYTTTSQSMFFKADRETDQSLFFGVSAVNGSSTVWNLHPSPDNEYALGTSSHRWSSVFAGTGTIQTSDRNKKENISYLSDDNIYVQLLMKLLPVSFTFKNDGENGLNNHDRTHIGFIAQDVEDAMKELGLTSLDFAGFCRDNKIVEHKSIDEETGEEIITEEVIEDEYIYSLRYSEFIALVTKGVQIALNKIDNIETKLADIESKIA